MVHHQQRQDRFRLVTEGSRPENDFEIERAVRLTVLEVLYTRRRLEPHDPGLVPHDLEEVTGTPREHLEFTTWFLIQKKLLQRSDSSKLTITAEGVEYLEQNHFSVHRQKLLSAGGRGSSDDAV